MLDHAAEYQYGVPAFNVNNLEQVQAIMMAAQACHVHKIKPIALEVMANQYATT